RTAAPVFSWLRLSSPALPASIAGYLPWPAELGNARRPTARFHSAADETMLKRLQLVGFKSFADKTDFDFSEGITAIVGPNGSGKSNIVDAVRWVLGEQSARSLRGSEMADVIFNGSSSRRSVGLAEVTMTFDNAPRPLATQAEDVHPTRPGYPAG